MAEPTRVGPGFEPVYDGRSRVLILGSFPSPQSRKQGFYYGHPQNRFWPLLARLCGEETPATIEQKKALLLRHRIALWDTLQSCTIVGASDASITDAVPSDVPALCRRAPIQAVFCNGAASHRLYQKHLAGAVGLSAARLPSTSPANAAWSPARLYEEWGRLLGPWLEEKDSQI